MDWFKGNFTGKPHIEWENRWFPVDFSLNQSNDERNHLKKLRKTPKKSPKSPGLHRFVAGAGGHLPALQPPGAPDDVIERTP